MTRRTLTFTLLATIIAASANAQAPMLEQGRAALGRGDNEAAVAVLEKAAAQYPKSAEVHYYLGSAYAATAQAAGMMAGMKYGPMAMSEYQKAVALNPKYVEPRFSLVQLYCMAPEMMGGSIDKALEQAKEIKSADPVYGHRAYAFIYTQQKTPDLGKKEYLDAIKEQPASAKAHSFFGLYLVNTEKNYTAAFTEFDAALKLDPAYMPAVYHIGRTAALANTNLERGEASLKKYLAYTPKEGEPTLASANGYLGTVYENEGKKTEAKQAYEAALKLNPTLKLAVEGLKRVS